MVPFEQRTGRRRTLTQECDHILVIHEFGSVVGAINQDPDSSASLNSHQLIRNSGVRPPWHFRGMGRIAVDRQLGEHQERRTKDSEYI